MTASYAESIATAPSAFERAHQHGEQVERALRADELLHAEHGEVEAFVEKQGREWARLMLEAQLALRAEREQRVEVVGANGIVRTRKRDTERHLQTVVGEVLVPRFGYQSPGHGDLHPMDASLNLPPELYSHGLRERVAKEAARASFDEVVEMITDYTGATVAKRQVEELAVRAARDFDSFFELRQRDGEQETSELMVISTDGKGIVMRHDDPAGHPFAYDPVQFRLGSVTPVE